ncbi:MAG: bifunctional proline dehydrogenase/L-glutamate gamma-semialdehyde dehydrogenase [Planctomycetota bacterium]
MNSSFSKDAEKAIELTSALIEESRRLQTPAEKRQQSELDRMIGNRDDKATLIEMTDQAFRTHTAARVADQLTHLLDVQGIPRFFSPVEQTMLRGFRAFGEYLPGVAVPLVKDHMRRETANVILPAERELLSQHIRHRQDQDVTMNVNLLGEALVGESETAQRMEAYFDVLRMPDVRCLSVKLTTIYSHVSALARDHTVAIASDRLERLYRVANRQVDPDSGQGKFVYLDMEEYRDLHLTADVLRNTLQRDGLEQTIAGIALQAYVPDSYRVMLDLIEWSRKRTESGGRPLTIRLVKGANMEMERVDASIGGYPQAPYSSKADTDANYKRMLRTLLIAASQGHLRVGIATHNLFDVALAMVWIDELGCGDAVRFEMLEGMANHQRRVITQHEQSMWLYAPACKKSDFLHAIGYLIRRLDENTGENNFLRHSYRLQSGTPDFERLSESFRRSLERIDDVSEAPRRTQDRRELSSPVDACNHWTQFVNEPDTDWSLPHHAEWAKQILQRWQSKLDDGALSIEPVTACESLGASETVQESYDVSCPDRVSCRYRLASLESVRASVERAHDANVWRDVAAAQRRKVLREVAQCLRQRRGDLIGGMVADAGKTVAQADPEVSEAIDFCEFYPLSLEAWSDQAGIRVEPRGVVAVITPWNFPLAIACGGVAAALSAGNPVILKPARETLLSAWQLCQAFWDSGVPREALQFLPCEDQVAEEGLVKNKLVDTVILTGGTATAKRMLAVRPDLHLLAETGGKNATIVTALADRDLAIKHVVDSAFGHSGQKCSATSILLLEDEVFDDLDFRERLADAVRSLHVGSSWDLHTDVTPLVCPPNEDLTRGLKELEDEESWLVTPEHVEGHPTLHRPGVKWNVKPGSFSHRTELFGPVLSVMRYGRLEEAIGIVRSTGYGLTSGLESLDDREIALWKESIPAGNLYINRPTTGAIVLRQPFGGVGLSAYGPGVKAGGPHYVLALSRIHDAAVNPSIVSEDARTLEDHGALNRFLDWLRRSAAGSGLQSDDRSRVEHAIFSQAKAVVREFSGERDTFGLTGQDNLRRYRLVEGMAIRFEESDSLPDALVALAAGIAVGTPLTFSMSTAAESSAMEDMAESLADWLPGMIHPVTESPAALVERITSRHVQRLRCLSAPTPEIRQACGKAFVTLIVEPVVDEGGIECLRYLNEQSISYDYHRYGNLGRRAPDDPEEDGSAFEPGT